MSTITKTAEEKIFKEGFMQTLISTLSGVNMEPARVIDYGTIAIPIQIGGEDRYITLKVVVTKAYDEEKSTGFDIFDAEAQYTERVEADAKKLIAKELKTKENLEKRTKKEVETKAKKEAEAKLKAAEAQETSKETI